MQIEGAHLRVLTFNVLALEHSSGSERSEVIRHSLAEYQADVVVL